MLVFRDVGVNDQEQRQFAATLGEVRFDSVMKEELLKIDYLPGNFFWHMDGFYEEIPPFATVLSPRNLPAEGGQTEFASTYAAYEDLSEEDKDYMAGLHVVHTMQSANFYAQPDAGPSQIDTWFRFPIRTHPLIWNHQTGRKSIVLGSSSSHVVDMEPIDARELIERLRYHATSPQYVYRHTWRMGDMVIWDNTGTMHRARPYTRESGRLMSRYTINGNEKVA